MSYETLYQLFNVSQRPSIATDTMKVSCVMELRYNPYSLDALGPLVASEFNSNVKLIKDFDIKDNVVLRTSDYVLSSINAIICKLMEFPAMDPQTCNFLIWESTEFKIALKEHIFSSYGSSRSEIKEPLVRVIDKLQTFLHSSPELFNLGKVTIPSIVLWSNLIPLFTRGSPFKISGFEFLENFVNEVNSIVQFSDAWNILSENSDPNTISKLWRSLLDTSKNNQISINECSDKVRSRNEKSSQNAVARIQHSSEKNTTKVNPTTSVLSLETNGELSEFSFSDITAEDQKNAAMAFINHTEFLKTVYPSPKKPLPKSSGIRNILITSALPYVNNVPHLGNIVGSTLSASSFALYCDLVGYNVLSICGTDEYGTATETKALAENLTPRQICDKYHELHCRIYDWFQIKFDYFGRTSTSKHTEIVQDIFHRLWDKGFIIEDSVEQLFCEKCSKFLADRFVEGACPFCKFDDARGDQCDKCGRLINAIDLIKPRCKICQHCPIIRSSKHLFLDLPKIENTLNSFVLNRITDPTSLWTANARTISNTWLRDGLKPRCITRDLRWGVPVPLKGYTEKVFYVWFDAPIGYLSITANYTPNWKEWWQSENRSHTNNDDISVELFQFMAKDNVPFHAIIFPSCLLGVNNGHTLVKHLIATEYMNYENTKFSKSRGIGVFGDDAMNSGIISDVWRFYLLYRRPETQDSAFMWDDFMLVNNSELLNNFGNFINRALSFVSRFFASIIPPFKNLESIDIKFLARINQLFRQYVEHMEACRLREGVGCVLAISRLGNGYLQFNQPWVALKKEETKPRASVVISLASNVAGFLGALIYPFMPTIGEEIWVNQCNLSLNQMTLVPMIRSGSKIQHVLPEGHKIGKPTPLFRKIESSEVSVLAERHNGIKLDAK